MFYFCYLSSSVKRPTYFFTGTTGVTLYADVKDFQPHSYCTKQAKMMTIWDNSTIKSSEKLSNCLVHYLTQEYDPATKTVKDHDGLKVSVDPIGSIGSCLGTSFIRQLFLKNGQDLTIVPYDWRISVLDHSKPGGIYERLKQSIEKDVEATQTPAAIIAFSLGSLVSKTFLTTYVTKEWRDKHIARYCLLAPALAGSSYALESFLGEKFQHVPKADLDLIHKSIGYVPGLLNLLPNYHAYGDLPLVFGPNDEVYTAKNVTKAFKAFGTLEGDSQEIFRINEPVLDTNHLDLDIPTKVIYNSAVPTHAYYKFDDDWNELTILRDEGDGTVTSVGPKWICDTWKNTECLDIKCSSPTCGHGLFILNSDVLKEVYKFVTEENPSLLGYLQTNQIIEENKEEYQKILKHIKKIKREKSRRRHFPKA